MIIRLQTAATDVGEKDDPTARAETSKMVCASAYPPPAYCVSTIDLRPSHPIVGAFFSQFHPVDPLARRESTQLIFLDEYPIPDEHQPRKWCFLADVI